MSGERHGTWDNGPTECVHQGSRSPDVPQPRVGEICRKVSFCAAHSRTIVLRHLATLRPSTASNMKAIVL
eukprot:5971556-Prymnesium_polylepis.1